VRSNGGTAGVDQHSIGAYEKGAEKNLVELEKILRGEGNYRAKPVKRVWIPKIRKQREEAIKSSRGYRPNHANGDEECNRAGI